jgi:hypothetical protein
VILVIAADSGQRPIQARPVKLARLRLEIGPAHRLAQPPQTGGRKSARVAGQSASGDWVKSIVTPIPLSAARKLAGWARDRAGVGGQHSDAQQREQEQANSESMGVFHG